MNCRKRLQNTAYVTACSHIFCNGCANRSFTQQLSCPVCQSTLSGKYDIQQMDLAPTETYKSQILAGLSPEIVQDICFRSISMYMYQVTQEIQLQEMMYKQAIQKYKAEKSKSQNYEQNRDKEMNEIGRKVQALEQQRDQDKRTISELQQQLNQKTRICQKLQHMYDMNKQKDQHITMPVIPQQHHQQPQKHPHKQSFSKFGSFQSQSRYSNHSNDNISMASTAKSPIDILNTPRNYSPSRKLKLI